MDGRIVMLEHYTRDSHEAGQSIQAVAHYRIEPSLSRHATRASVRIPSAQRYGQARIIETDDILERLGSSRRNPGLDHGHPGVRVLGLLAEHPRATENLGHPRCWIRSWVTQNLANWQYTTRQLAGWRNKGDGQ